MARFRGTGGGQPALPIFAHYKGALTLITQRFSYMEHCVGFYLNPFIGRKRIYEIGNMTGGCCTINGDCTTPETAMQNGTCYLTILLVITLVLIIVTLINLIQHSDVSLIVIGSLIHIVDNTIQALHKIIILCNRKSLLTSDCSIPCCGILSMITCIIVLAPTVILSMNAHTEMDKSYDPETGQ